MQERNKYSCNCFRWGILDIDDCSTGVKHLIDIGEVDKDRICIDGRSAGGFTTLACLTFTDTFKVGELTYSNALSHVSHTHAHTQAGTHRQADIYTFKVGELTMVLHLMFHTHAHTHTGRHGQTDRHIHYTYNVGELTYGIALSCFTHMHTRRHGMLGQTDRHTYNFKVSELTFGIALSHVSHTHTHTYTCTQTHRGRHTCRHTWTSFFLYIRPDHNTEKDRCTVRLYAVEVPARGLVSSSMYDTLKQLGLNVQTRT